MRYRVLGFEESTSLISRFCQRLLDAVRQGDYYRQVYRLLGNNGGIENQLKQLELQLIHVRGCRTLRRPGRALAPYRVRGL